MYFLYEFGLTSIITSHKGQRMYPQNHPAAGYYVHFIFITLNHQTELETGDWNTIIQRAVDFTGKKGLLNDLRKFVPASRYYLTGSQKKKKEVTTHTLPYMTSWILNKMLKTKYTIAKIYIVKWADWITETMYHTGFWKGIFYAMQLVFQWFHAPVWSDFAMFVI